MTEKQYEEIRRICIKEKCFYCSSDIKSNCKFVRLDKPYNKLAQHEKRNVDFFEVHGFYLNQKKFL